jgi:hypothetical protein
METTPPPEILSNPGTAFYSKKSTPNLSNPKDNCFTQDN